MRELTYEDMDQASGGRGLRQLYNRAMKALRDAVQRSIGPTPQHGLPPIQASRWFF